MSGVDSESWQCQGPCHGQMIGRRPADDRCAECGPAGGAELAARITAARAVLGDYRADARSTLGRSGVLGTDWQSWAYRLADMLGAVLDQLEAGK